MTLGYDNSCRTPPPSDEAPYPRKTVFNASVGKLKTRVSGILQEFHDMYRVYLDDLFSSHKYFLFRHTTCRYSLFALSPDFVCLLVFILVFVRVDRKAIYPAGRPASCYFTLYKSGTKKFCKPSDCLSLKMLFLSIKMIL